MTRALKALPRFVTFDILRVIQLMPIAMLHAWEFMIGQDFVDESQVTTHYDTFQVYIGSYFNYSALYIVGISFFIWGLRDFKIKKFKFAVLLMGIIGLQLHIPEKWSETAGWGWDLYGFLVIAVLLCRALPNRKWVNWTVVVTGLVMLSVSLNEWVPIASLTPRPWSTALFARLIKDDVNGWFLVPWIFLPLLIFCTARLLRETQFFVKSNLPRNLAVAALLFVLAGLCYSLKPDPVPPMLGVHFYQFLFMQSPWHFWQHYLTFAGLALLMLSIEIEKPILFQPLACLQKLQWNQNFFFCYFLHFAWFNQMAQHRDLILSTPYRLDYLWLAILVITEITAQMFFRMLNFYPRLFQRIKKARASAV